MSRRPSILLVFADQMRGRDMGCAGNQDVRTPTLDALAEQGVYASRCYASVPVCTPNRATLLSGCYPTAHRTIAADLPMPESVCTFGEVACEAGYRTGYVGKWHLDGVPRSRFTPPGNRRHGFDFWAVYNCGHDYFRPRYYRDDPRVIEADGYEPVVQTDLALEFLAGLHPDDSFVLAVSWGPPHNPYDQVPQEFKDLYPDELSLPPNVDTDTDNPLVAELDLPRTFSYYYAAITALDEQLGRLLAGLDGLGRTHDTVVLFTSDHGDLLGAHGLTQKQAPYEESVHVPMIFRWPAGLPAGTERTQLMATVDLAPTILALVGLPVPAQMQGNDLSSVLREGGAGQGSILLANPTSFGAGARQGLGEWRAVRNEHYTYVERPGRRPWLLFDNTADPWQMTNLVQNPTKANAHRKLAGQLTEWLKRTNDPFLTTEEMIDYVGMRHAWECTKRGFEASGPPPEPRSHA